MTAAVTIAPVPDVATVAPFALSSWLRAFLPLAVVRYNIGRREAHERLHGEMTRLLYRQRVVLASLTDEPDVFIGWACGDGEGALHYAYVKAPFRLQGFGRRLIDAAAGGPRTYTFLPPTARGKPRSSLLRVFHSWGMHYEPIGLVAELERKRDAEEGIDPEDRARAVS